MTVPTPSNRQQMTGYIVAGETSSFGVEGNDMWVLKLDPSGNVSWQKTYGGSNVEKAYTIQQTTDGSYIVAGEASSFGSGSRDMWILKLDANGSIIWQKNFEGVNNDYASLRPTDHWWGLYCNGL